MKKLNHKNALSATVSMLMTLTVCSSVSQASDIDIYSNATGGKTTIMLMLDTSGSMSAVRMTDGSACELSPDTAYTLGEEPSGTTPPYTKYYCGVDIPGSSSQRVYYYKRTGPSGNRSWFSCGASGSPNVDACTIPINDPDPNNSFEDTGSNPRYYYKNERPKTKHYDRLTRLKDAIFTLMDSNQIDSNSVAMGIGQFSSQSESNNVFTSADGTSGKIVVPAALLSTTQRTAIKTAVANLQGSGGTPTANAYAEVAAYMLGETTATGSSNYQGYFLLTGGNAGYYAICRQWSGTTCTSWDGFYYQSGFTPSGYTAGTTGTLSGYAGRYYLGEKIDRGFAKSVTTSKSGAKYISPLSTTNTQCDGQGIYFLTDGQPNSSYDPVSVMQKALGSTGSSFSVPTTGTLPDGSQGGHGMPAVGEFAKALRNQKASTTAPNRNPLGLEIKTAVVGFGSVFDVNRTADAAQPEADRIIRTLDYINSRGERTNEQREYYNCSLITDVDARNACNWGAKPHPDLPSSVGGYGNGGFYSAQSTNDVIQSVVKFLDEVRPEFDPIATGSPTLPQDALNPLRIQPYGYYGSFIPKPQESTQLWVGNMNKYHIFNGELYNASKTIRLIKSDGSLDAAAKGLWTDEGMKGQLPLGIGTNAANEQVANRTIYTNREITGTAAPYAASEIGSLKKVNVATLFGTGSTALFVNDPDKNYWLNLLGYNVAETGTVTLADLITKPELRQVGSVMHSTPILLTQSGKISYTSGTIDTTDRDDYLLFGSTQGLLHVVRAGKNATDANRGKEVFAFAPNEMMQNQKNAFLSETSSTLGKNNLFYGIDAPWTAYTQYVAKADGTLTVKDSGRVAQNASGDDIAIKGLQWVYGGLRMGGKSYYALNLSDLDNPELKFHIDPASSKIYKSSSTTTGVTALSYMGQSWSKPTIAYVKFGGVKKLVMFVGGGYDPGYENAAYDQTNGIGAGVYMFDANNGDLLWWTSANATAAGGAEAYTNASATSINMKYSVVSQINAIDRDNDGLVDNLYFGDLGGQAFRVDLNNAATGTTASDKKANFAKRVVRLFDEHATGGASPRFYEMPSVSIHDSDNGYVAAVAFSSGNRSSPLVGTAVVNGNQAGSTTSATDGVFVVYDKDVAKTDLYGTPTLTTPTALSSLNSNMSTGVAINGNSGWKYTYSSTAGAYKGMNELYALDGMLYVNVFHRDGTGIGGSCGAGVKGDSYVYQFCLPTGKCPFNTTTSGVPNRVKLGAGILGAGLGQGRSSANNTGLIVNRPNTLNCTTTPNLPECQEFTTTAKLRQLRWYETR
ncbi:pilus assembly protein PilC [Acinetobacter junii]|uniref:pilus assembly protein PilC n=1 Tax=Acinetobacter junii TaxID=40215 RepID=UPI0010A99DA4|nr:pilus assembly protein PilC [Acinetobacter junii]TID71563.1 pilus assembly protein PilC [Acinetobacter junii]TIE07300.1 pilus assembly protein PilC [Acinetobacter junii]